MKHIYWDLGLLIYQGPGAVYQGAGAVTKDLGLLPRTWGCYQGPGDQQCSYRFWKVLEIDQCVFQDLESLGKSSFLSWAMESYGNLSCSC